MRRRPIEKMCAEKPRISYPVLRVALQALLVVSILIIALEFGARVLFSNVRNPNLSAVIQDYSDFANRLRTVRFTPDAVLTYRLAPRIEIEHADGGVTRHNSAGFRHHKDFAPKGPGIRRIVCLGGSTTYGTGVSDNADAYPAQLERLLNERSESERAGVYEVLNLGVGGYTSLEVLRLLETEALALEPDAVLIQVAINDVGPRLYPGFVCDYSHFRKPMRPLPDGPVGRALVHSRFALVTGWALGIFEPLTLQARTQRPLPPVSEAIAHFERSDAACFVRNMRDAVARCQAAGVDVYLLTEAYVDFPPPAGADEAAVRLESLYKDGLRQHNAALMEIAADTGAGLIDLYRLMPGDRAFYTDPIHANEAGNEAKAAIIAEELLDHRPD